MRISDWRSDVCSSDLAMQSRLIDAAASAVERNVDRLTALDQAIGDGDHGINLRRGLSAIVEQKDKLAVEPLGKALQSAGLTLVMKVGGASGPLYGSLLKIGRANV